MQNLKELKEAIAALVAYNRDEERDWMENVAYGKGPDYKRPEYDPALCPGHIYHTIRKLEEFIK
jgi:hypothetical protein